MPTPKLRAVLELRVPRQLMAGLGLLVGTFALTGCLGSRITKQSPANLSESTGSPSGAGSTNGLGLIPSPRQLHFGQLPPGSEVEKVIWLKNHGNEPVTVSEVESSCSCLTLRLDRATIEPGGQTEATAVLDLNKEPDFTGGLLMTIKGFTRDRATRKEVFELTAEVDVLHGR